MPTRAPGLFYGWRVVGACFFIAIVAWTLGLFGASVYLQAISSARGWAIGDISAAITLMFLVSASVQRIVGGAIDRFGPRPVLLLGTVLKCLGAALVGQVSEIWQLYVCFVLIGLGWSTLSTTGITSTVAPWFERHQGRSMTLAIMGASGGAIVGVPVLLLALDRLGLANGLLTVGLGCAVLLVPLITIVLRYRGPADLGLFRDGDVASARQVFPKRGAPIAQVDRPSILLWTLTAGFALALTIQIGFITHHVALAVPLLGLDGAGLLVAGAGAVAFIGRLVLAAIVDRVSVRLLAVVIMAAQTLALLSLAVWPTVPVLIVASLVYGYGIGHVTTLGPVVVRREFGAQAFGATYGSAATIIQLTSATGPALFGWLRDWFGGYELVLVIAAGVTTVAAMSLLLGGYLGRQPRRS